MNNDLININNEKKDTVIKEALIHYTSAVNIPNSVINPARQNLRRIRSGRRMKLLTAAVAAIFIIFGISYIANSLMNSTPELTYSTVSLKRINSEINNVSIEGLKIIKNAGQVLSVKEFINKNNGEIYVISIEYLFLGLGGTERLLVVADIKGGLTDYVSYQDYHGDDLKQQTVYENGEYYTFGFFEDQKIKYYLILMSPISSELNEYVHLMS